MEARTILFCLCGVFFHCLIVFVVVTILYGLFTPIECVEEPFASVLYWFFS
jgi:hypothetical protein